MRSTFPPPNPLAPCEDETEPARPTPDLAFAALPLLERVRDALRNAAPPAGARRWGVPDLFFFDPDLQTEWAALGRPASRDWGELPDLLDDALTVLAAGVTARHAARAVPGLADAANVLAPHHPRARQLADVLAVPDDEVVLAVHPAARAGFRVLVRGVADVYQFHALLADAVTGDPRRGRLPGARPDARVVEIYRNAPPTGEQITAAARFQFLRPEALRPDGTVPPGFGASDHWLWGPEPLAALPRVNGERAVLIAEPTFRATWDAARKLPWLDGELELVEVLTPAAVGDWLAARTGRPVPITRDRERRAA
jgi:hypothetical protein